MGARVYTTSANFCIETQECLFDPNNLGSNDIVLRPPSPGPVAMKYLFCKISRSYHRGRMNLEAFARG